MQSNMPDNFGMVTLKVWKKKSRDKQFVESVPPFWGISLFWIVWILQCIWQSVFSAHKSDWSARAGHSGCYRIRHLRTVFRHVMPLIQPVNHVCRMSSPYVLLFAYCVYVCSTWNKLQSYLSNHLCMLIYGILRPQHHTVLCSISCAQGRMPSWHLMLTIRSNCRLKVLTDLQT